MTGKTTITPRERDKGMFNSFLKNHSISEYSFSSELFPRITNRDFWDKFPNSEVIGKAEQELGYDYPIIKATDYMEYKQSGNRAIMENIHFDRRRHLTMFALAELKENKGRFLPQILNGLFAICEETFWGVSAHLPGRPQRDTVIPDPTIPYIDLFAAETAEHLAVMASVLKEPLEKYCPSILDRIEYELEKRIKEPYLSHRDFVWMAYTCRASNWNPWILSNLVTVFLLTEKNEEKLNCALEKMFEEIGHYYDSLPADGGCDEGPAYWEKAGAALFEFLYQIKLATNGKLDLFDDEKLCKIASYLKKVHIADDYFAPIADSQSKGFAFMMPLLYGFGRETKQTDLMNFAAAVYSVKPDYSFSFDHRICTMRRLIFNVELVFEMLSHKISYPLHPALEYLPDMQLASLRNGDFYLCVKGGFNAENHNHNDVGSIIFYDKATPVLVDVGINTYTKFTFLNQYRYTIIPWTRSSYHNLPIINGTEQKHGRDYRADSFEANESAVKVSFAKAYEDAKIKSAVREAAVSEKGIRITDSFVFEDADKKEVTEVLMSVLPVRIENGDAILGDAYRIHADCGEISSEFVPFDDSHLEHCWGTTGVYRIKITVKDANSITITAEKTDR